MDDARGWRSVVSSRRRRAHAEQDAAAWRDPLQVASQWLGVPAVDPDRLRYRATGRWWDVLAASGLTLLVTREYEHLVMAIGTAAGRPSLSYLPLPHPSGLALDRARGVVHVASTRNPNQIYDLRPAARLLRRQDADLPALTGRPLIPVRTRFLPGCLYVHDLAFIGGRLHITAVGENAVVQLLEDGRRKRVWWPRCIERSGSPIFGRNHIQLNSIAAGRGLRDSYFTASAAEVTRRRPGQRNFPVDGRGVIFSGATREPVVTGLTRPHSARVHRGRLWVANSGYGELGFVEDHTFVPAAALGSWTRGLFLHRGIAFIATSRVLPRFTQYAPGVDAAKSQCGIHAIDIRSGEALGSLVWPNGNQIFAIEGVPRTFATGFPQTVGRKMAARRTTSLFFAFETHA
jgi:uncharacterized protein (TIGR03032 family)